MHENSSVASILIFAGSLLSFFLPFATVSCGSVNLVTLTGIQLATGEVVKGPDSSQDRRVDPDPLTDLALVCAIAGLVTTLVGRHMAGVSASCGGIGLASLLISKVRMDEQVQQQGMGLIKINSELGFTLAVLLLLAGAIWNSYIFSKRKRAARAAVFLPVAIAARPPDLGATDAFCGNCGAELRGARLFCSECGSATRNSR